MKVSTASSCIGGCLEEFAILAFGAAKKTTIQTGIDSFSSLSGRRHFLVQVKFQLKKVLCMGVAVGNVAMTPDELR